MKQHFLGLRTAIYKVPDLGKATEWYAKVLGFDPYFNEPFYVGFNVAGYELGLLPDGDETSKEADNVQMYWGVEDIQSMYDRLLLLGATELEKPTNVGGELMVATVRDPWGNVFGIIYNPHFKLP